VYGRRLIQQRGDLKMQNAVNNQNGENVVGITSAHVTDAIKRVHESNEMFTKEVADNAERMTESVSIIKKDGTKEQYNVQKVVNAVKKSATRMLITFSDEELKRICDFVNKKVSDLNKNEISIWEIHNIVESALESINPTVAQSYRNYRNYKTDFVAMLDKVYQESQKIMYIGDKENSNSDSALVSTKRSLIFNQLNKELYKKFFLTVEDLQAIREGYIYIHDMSARRDTMNCCLFDVAEVLKGGFEMGNLWYNEPKTLDVAFDVIGDIVMAAASQQYGGFTVPEVDKILAPYAEKSYQKQYDRYICMGLSFEKAREEALKDVKNDYEQGFQGWEYKFNTVASSRGDYPFITMTIGLGTGEFEKMASMTMLQIHAKGQGKKENKKPVLFPKIVFLYDEELHGEGGISHDLFEAGVECSRKTMYPDWLSLTGDGYVASMYKKYKKVISPMGCRAFLSPWYERGGMKPADENDVPVFVGRFNIGAVSLHLPMILAKARQESKDFYEVLDYYLEMIRKIHIRTYEYLGEMRASINPLAYCEGGFYGGHLKPHDKIKPLLKAATASFGITALNELQELYNGKSLVEDGQFAIEVMEYINKKVAEFKEADGNLYALYGTPAENLCGLQVKQFRKKYGIKDKVSDRGYVSNSFHCHVSEEISPIQKQDLENRFWNLFNGGKIQYVKYPLSYNKEAIKTLLKRAMDKGFYEGVNLSLAYCDDCGHQELAMDVCPKCGSRNLTKIDRMNGYLSYSRVNGDTRLNEAKMEEIADRVSM
jgi:ribonucleoside-triphosphate reductase